MVVVRDAPWRQLVARVAALEKLRVKVGVLSGKGGDVVEPGSDITVAELAAVHEFGTATVPERSFIRSTFIVQAGALRALTKQLATKFIEGKMPANRALGLLGAWATAQIKNQITQHDIPPPLKPETIAAKGSSKPLVDTGQLLNSISWQVDAEAAE